VITSSLDVGPDLAGLLAIADEAACIAVALERLVPLGSIP
jgi:hypothetical protein